MSALAAPTTPDATVVPIADAARRRQCGQALAKGRVTRARYKDLRQKVGRMTKSDGARLVARIIQACPSGYEHMEIGDLVTTISRVAKRTAKPLLEELQISPWTELQHLSRQDRHALYDALLSLAVVCDYNSRRNGRA